MVPAKGVSGYVISKAAHVIWAQKAFAPGAVRTNIMRNMPVTDKQGEAIWDAMDSKYPVGRCEQGIDITNAVAYLASDQASFVACTILVADGGHLAANINMRFD
ncbi:unnamed protein product [Medioppia subpectinata]|uniref:Uncharacterized protein n=1 Tax=Medioppia subpectinata TaxID=1979941 RepID=A0A7R9L009_9ACAR|nr:unnamed protein product [Medioppia subpectinata]CAG2112680.1 unnamed protein product [Medioppia subpectinata]